VYLIEFNRKSTKALNQLPVPSLALSKFFLSSIPLSSEETPTTLHKSNIQEAKSINHVSRKQGPLTSLGTSADLGVLSVLH
jgi:hypothetical protein